MNLDFAKRYAKQGYFVFPTFRGRQGQQMKPYGWALNQLDDLAKKAKAIPATNLEIEIAELLPFEMSSIIFSNPKIPHVTTNFSEVKASSFVFTP